MKTKNRWTGLMPTLISTVFTFLMASVALTTPAYANDARLVGDTLDLDASGDLPPVTSRACLLYTSDAADE